MKTERILIKRNRIFAFALFRSTWIAFFVTVILTQSGLLSVYTVCRIKTHRQEMKRLMKNSLKTGCHEDELVSFTEEQLATAKWEHESEFFLGKSKYDVVITETVNGITIYVCVNDTKETELYKALDRENDEQFPPDDHLRKVQFSEKPQRSDAYSPEFRMSHSSREAEDFYDYHPVSGLFRPPILQLQYC